MKKKYLSIALFGALLTVSLGTFTSCKDYDDDINGLDQRVTAVEKSVAELKTRIEAGAVITSVTPDNNGVTVTLSDGKTFQLKNGTNGTNGSVVSIGANGNWFIDGKDSGMPSQGAKGEQGEQGKPGDNGTSSSAIYYYPGVEGTEAGFWVKVTKSADGTEVKEVTKTPCVPEGKEAVSAVWDAANGYLILTNVDGSKDPVKIKLTDTLRSLAFVPETIDTKLGMGVIDFYTLLVQDKLVANKYDFLVSNNPIVTYRLNPQNADVKDIEWSFIDRVVNTRVAGDNEVLLKIMNAKKGEKGGMVFQLQSTKTLDYLKENQNAIFALKASNKEDATEIVSDYAVVKASVLKQYGIAKIKDGKATTTPATYYSTVIPTLDTPADVKFVYTSELNLNTITEAWAKEIEKSLISIGVEKVTYEFSKPDKYLGSDGKTNQQQFVTAPKDGIVTVDKAWLSQGTASQGRTPIFKVAAMVNGTVVASAYIKAEITPAESVAQGDLTVKVALGNIEYASIANPANTYELSWDRANSEIYDVLGMSKTTFQQNYDDYFVANETGVTAIGWTLNNSSTTGTAMAWINMTPQVLLGEGVAKVTYKAKNNFAHKNVVITFTYNVVHAQKFPELNPDYLIGTDIVQVKGKILDGSWKLVSEMKEQFKNYMSDYKLPGNHNKLYFRFKRNMAQTGASISDGDYKNQEIKLTTPFTKNEDSRDYKIEMVAELSNGRECVKEYTIRFVRPFNAEVNAMTLKTYMANPDSKDLSKLVVIKDRDNKTVYENGAYTSYGKTTYKLDQGNVSFGYGLSVDASFGNKLTIINNSWVNWYNGGTDLQQNKSAKSVVTITIPEISTIEAKGDITVLSTENSK